MRTEYDFSKGDQGPEAPAGETSVTTGLDDDILDWFRSQVHAAGGGNYQSMINAALREYVTHRKEPLEDTLRRVVREELNRSAS